MKSKSQPGFPTNEEPFEDPIFEKLPSCIRRSKINKIFGQLNTTSMRLLVLNTVIGILTMNFFSFPLFFRTYGLVFGSLLIVGTNLFNYWTWALIYEASEYTKINSLTEMIEHIFGRKVKGILSVSFFMDYFSNYVFILIQSWVCFQFICFQMGLIDSSAIVHGDKLEFHQYHPEILGLRLIFVGSVFFLFTPVFLQESYETVKCITVYCVVFWFMFIMYMMADFLEFREYYANIGKLKITMFASLSGDQLRMFFILLSGLYIQSSLMTMKSEIANLNIRRMLKSSKIAFLYMLFLTFGLGLFFYCCLGDHYTNDVFMVRKSFIGKQNENVYILFLGMLLFLNLAYIKFYHQNMKSFIQARFQPKKHVEFWFIFPWICSLTFVFLYPKVLNFYGYCACTIFLLNGYIFPILMKRRIDLDKGKSAYRIWAYNLIISALLVLAVLSLWQILKSE